MYGRGRPSSQKPRPVKAMRYRLKTTIRPRQSGSSVGRKRPLLRAAHQCAYCGDLAHRARDILTVYKDQHGTEQNYGFLKDPVIVNSLVSQEARAYRSPAFGVIARAADLAFDGTVHARVCRHQRDAPDRLGPQGHRAADHLHDSHEVCCVIIVKLGDHRQLARPLSVVQQQYLTALDVAVACFTDCPSG